MANLNVIYRIAADISGLQDGVNRAAGATERLEGLAKRAGLAFASAFSVQQIAAFVQQTTKAFAEEEAASNRLLTALKAQGTFTPTLVRQYADLASQFQKTTAFSDDLVLEMEALLTQVGDVMPAQMGAALKAATDLSAGLGIDLRAATLLVGKAFAGETGTLKRYGIVIDETKLKTDGAAAVMEGINAKFGGQAQAQVEGYAGKMQQFANVADDARERVGELLSSGLKPLQQMFISLPPSLQTTAVVVQGLTPNLETMTLAILAMGGPGGAVVLLTRALSLLWPVVAVGATAFVAWKLGRWIGEVSGLTDKIEYLSLRLQGFSAAEAKAAIAIRKQLEASTAAAAGLKEQGGAVGRTTALTVSYVAQVKAAQAEVAKLTADQRSEIVAAKQLGVDTEVLTKQYGLSETALRLVTDQTKASTKATVEDTAEKERNLSAVRALELGTTQLSSSIAVWRFQLVEAIDPAEGVRFHVRAIEDATVGLTAATRKLIPGLVTVNGRLADIEDASVATAGDLTHLGNVVEDVGLKTSTFDDDLEDLAKGFATLAQISGDSFAGAVRDVANVVAAWSLARTAADQYRTATTNAGRAAALAAGAAAVGQATGSGSTGSRVSGGAVTGASVGSIFGPVGTAVGAGVGALVGWIRGHRDAAKAMEALRQEGQQLINAAGGINDLAQRALGAGTGISALLDAMNSDNPEKLRAELIRLTTAIDFQDQAMQTLDETVAKYNFTVAEKGPALALREQAKTAERLYKDWQVLLTAGVDVNAVAREMGGSINAFVQNAMVMGQEVPEEMRAIILKMIELGQLTDADGKKITSLEETGITFSESMTAGVNRIVVAVEKLIAAITRGLTQAIENVPDIEVDRVVTTTYTEEPRSGDDAGTASGRPEGAATGGRVTLRGLQRFASGGVVLPWPMQPRGTDTVPIMATPGEVILNRGQQEAVGDRLAAAGSRQTITIDNRILLDGQEMKRWQRDTFVQDAEDNVGGFRTRAQDALGVAS